MALTFSWLGARAGCIPQFLSVSIDGLRPVVSAQTQHLAMGATPMNRSGRRDVQRIAFSSSGLPAAGLLPLEVLERSVFVRRKWLPVRYGLDLYILCRSNLVFKGVTDLYLRFVMLTDLCTSVDMPLRDETCTSIMRLCAYIYSYNCTPEITSGRN